MSAHLDRGTSFGDENTRAEQHSHATRAERILYGHPRPDGVRQYGTLRLATLCNEFVEAIREGRADRHLDALLSAIHDREGDILAEGA